MRSRVGWGTLGSVFLGLLIGPMPTTAQAADGGPPPDVFDALEGEWAGTGELMGRAAAFAMTWETLGGPFVGLHFSNSFAAADGRAIPVLEAHALYRFDGEAGMGAWLDDRPQQITIRALATDSSVVSQWVADSEEGRTEYVVRSPDEVVVRDWVYTDDGERLFAEATYRRVGPERP